jgi:Flp pilus assembly protein TadG
MLHNRIPRHRFALSGRPRQRGASMVPVAVSLVVLLGLGALTLDGGNLYVARNELQNASDAGALAGARMLYVDDGSMVNPGANQVAHDAAIANSSQGTPVEVVSVQRGHWSFTTRTFTPNPSLEPVDLFNTSTTELDLNVNFINAVEVVTERNATPVQAFLGSVLGFSGYSVSARAVAYIGFAGTLRLEDVDQPIAICSDAITDGNEYSYNVGRFIPDHSDAGGWTNFRHDDSGATNANELNQLICSNGNPDPDGSHAYWSDDPQERGWKQKTIYFLPDCTPHEPIGRTGGENFGILAQIPVLVD